MTVRQCTHQAPSTGERCTHPVADTTPTCAAGHPNTRYQPATHTPAAPPAEVGEIAALLNPAPQPPPGAEARGATGQAAREALKAQIQELHSQLHAEHPDVRLGLSACSWGGMTLDLIVVSKQRRGHGEGSAIIRRLCNEADRHQWTLALNISTDFGGSKSGLERLYRRFGFVPNRGRRTRHEISERWVREPSPQP